MPPIAAFPQRSASSFSLAAPLVFLVACTALPACASSDLPADAFDVQSAGAPAKGGAAGAKAGSGGTGGKAGAGAKGGTSGKAGTGGTDAKGGSNAKGGSKDDDDDDDDDDEGPAGTGGVGGVAGGSGGVTGGGDAGKAGTGAASGGAGGGAGKAGASGKAGAGGAAGSSHAGQAGQAGAAGHTGGAAGEASGQAGAGGDHAAGAGGSDDANGGSSGSGGAAGAAGSGDAFVIGTSEGIVTTRTYTQSTSKQLRVKLASAPPCELSSSPFLTKSHFVFVELQNPNAKQAKVALRVGPVEDAPKLTLTLAAYADLPSNDDERTACLTGASTLSCKDEPAYSACLKATQAPTIPANGSIWVHVGNYDEDAEPSTFALEATVTSL